MPESVHPLPRSRNYPFSRTLIADRVPYGVFVWGTVLIPQ